MGPWTLSYHLYNVQEFLYDTLIDPDRVRLSLETLKHVPLVFAKAQLEAGADAMCGPTMPRATWYATPCIATSCCRSTRS